MRKPVSTQSMTIELNDIRRNAQFFCREQYNPMPFHDSTDKQAWAFSMRQALSASLSIPMTDDELRLYAGSIYESIQYFNKRDQRHSDYMDFLRQLGVTKEDTIEKQQRRMLAKMRRHPQVITDERKKPDRK